MHEGNTSPTPVLELRRLGGLGTKLGSGGQADVYDLPNLRIPDISGRLVYKKYRFAHGAPASLRGVVSARARLDSVRRRQLDAIAVWPSAVVEDDGLVCGIVMPRVPERYFDTVTLRGTGTTKKSLREVQNLFVAPDRARQLGRPVPADEQRLAICRDFAAALSFYHDELSVVFGDINPRNELYRLDARPMVLFLDCDGVRPTGVAPTTQQLNTPDWAPPDPGPLTRATDLYKLGLFILRCLTPGPGSSTRHDPAAETGLDAIGCDLLRDALGADPGGRPTASTWWQYFSRLLGEPVQPPKLTEVRIDRAFVLTGQPVEIHWTAQDAVTLECFAGSHPVRIDAAAGSGTVRVPLIGSGFVHVRASNGLGVDERTVGPIAVLPAPEVLHLPVPLPEPPWPESVLPPLPDTRLPLFPAEVPGPAPAQPTSPGPAWPALTSVRFPLDIASLLTNGPALDFGDTRAPERT